jgi:UDP-glucose 4-epimerase
MKILVTGGAGYIGSACVKDLCKKGHQVTVIDNLFKGKRELVDPKARFEKMDLLDRKKLLDFLGQEKFDSVIHFAAHKDAGASMQDAIQYSENIRMILNILDGMAENKIPQIVFSSSAAVYGDPEYLPMDEKHPVKPVNYYGETKLISEKLMDWYAQIYGIKYVALRYFNVAGDHGLNYIDPNAKNLFPIIQEVLDGKREKLEIYGDDYETRDGTGVRDYIHLSDLVEAHIKSLNLKSSEIINLGTGKGQSVLEVVTEFEKQSGREVKKVFQARCQGDPAEIFASSKKAKNVLGWHAKKGLKEMVESTLRVSG